MTGTDVANIPIPKKLLHDDLAVLATSLSRLAQE